MSLWAVALWYNEMDSSVCSPSLAHDAIHNCMLTHRSIVSICFKKSQLLKFLSGCWEEGVGGREGLSAQSCKLHCSN